MLTFPERLRFVWECLWPVLALDAARSLVFYGLLDLPSSDSDTVYQLAAFFIAGPLAVRRALRLRYPAFRIAALRGGAEFAPGYSEAFKVYWLLGWRSLVLLLPLLLALSLAMQWLAPGDLSASFAGVSSSPMANSLALALVDVLFGLLLMPWIVPGMLRKRYRDFEFEVERPSRSTPRKAASVQQR
jgi:hypothetical protein